MTEFVTCRLQCPVCATQFVADEVHGVSSIGRDTDFRPIFEGPDPLLSNLHSCPKCCYSAYREGFETERSDELLEFVEDDPRSLPRALVSLPDEEDVADLRRYTRSGELKHGVLVEGQEPFGAARYLLAAKVHEFLRDEEPLAVAHYYLRSAWSARVSKDRILEKHSLREVLLRLSPLLEANASNDGDRLRWSYLAGEMARRVGDFTRAVDFFGHVEKDADLDEDEGSFLAALARRQSVLALVKSDVNAAIPHELPGRRRRRDGGDEESFDDDDGGESSLN
jgi:uncharacterized protein (DUF2225 family)